jgi:hypothetical protein
MSKSPRTSLWIVLVFCLVGSALAQTASVSGTVTDSSGAVVPQTTITARNLATNASRDAATDSAGTYRITNLVPGFYDVRVEKGGFKTVEYSRMELTVGQVQSLNPVLAPSATPETVTVHGQQVPPIDLDDAQIGDVVKSQQIEALPLILRDPYQLILLSPGAIQGNSILQGLSVNGSRERNNNFLLDGTDNNDAEIPGLTLPQPGLTALNPDSVQEFRVITSSFLPEFGRNTGAVIDIVSKRGTNAFHTDAYWFGRFDALGARDYFNHQVDSSGQVVRKDPYTHNTFGVSAGGPLLHDKTFWFANYDGERFDTTLTNTSVVPTAAFKTGVFTFTDSSGQQVPIDLNSPENIFGLPLDPTMQNILALYPAPNGPSVDGARGTLYFPSPTHTTSDNANVRIDHNFSKSENLSVRYTFNRFEDPNFDHTDFLPGLGGTGTKQRRQNATLQLTTVIDPRLLNNFRLGANRINFPLTCQGLSVLDSFSVLDLYGRGVDVPIPGINGFGCLFIVDRNGSKRFSGTYTIGDDVTWARGQHTFKFGVETHDSYSNSTNGFYSRTTLDFNNVANYGPFFSAFATGDPSIDSNQTLQDMVWALFGNVGSVTQAQFFNKQFNRTANDLRGFRQEDFGAFAQDTFKVLPNLTLNYGLRYQYNGVPYEVNDLLSTLFTDPSGQAPFTFTIAGRHEHGLPPLYSKDWHDFEPRIGIAWDPTREGRMSVRAGYGIFHDRLFGQLLGLTRGNPPFQQIFFQPLFGAPPCVPPAVQSQLGLCIGPPLSQLPPEYPPSLGTSLTVEQGAGDLPFIIAPNLRMPYSQSWNFGVQRELPGRMSVELNYVGSKGTRLLRLVDGNPPQPALVAQLEAFCSQPNPFNCSQSTLQFNNLWFGAESFLLPFDAVNNNAFLHAEIFNNASSSVYHALQANLTRRMANGLTFQAAYTWAHAIDNSSDPLTPAVGNQGFPRNSLDLGAERGNSDFDVRQRLVINYSYAIPFGRGHDHFADGFGAALFGGWEVAGVTTFSSGLPFDIFSALDTAHTGQQQRADFNPAETPIPVADPRTQTGPNLGLFSDPAWGSAGNLGRNHFYGPGVNRWDMVLQRHLALTEKLHAEFRAEAYNLFNRAQFGQPGNVISDTGTFGQSTSEVRQPDLTTGARQIQVGVKVSF